MDSFWEDLRNPVNLAAVLVAGATLAASGVYVALRPRFFLLMLKNLRRNLLRTLLICVATFVLVAMVILIWTVISFLDQATQEKANDFKIIVTERWQLPSQMPPTHANYLNPEHPAFLPELAGKYGKNDFMTWSFYGGTTEPGNYTRESIIFFFALDPYHIRPMMDDLDKLDPALVQKLVENRRGCLVGKDRLAMLNKKVGERFRVYSMNYKGIDLEFEILGELPEARYGQSAIMNAAYFNDALDQYKQQRGVPHPLDQKRLNLIWIRVKDKASFDEIGGIIENAPVFANTPVKVEMASSAIGNFLEGYKDMLAGVRYILVPTMLVIMALVVANAIAISVRERRTEIAVMKVLGYRPGQILGLVIGEAMVLGTFSGLVAAVLIWGGINAVGGVKFQIAFFPAFPIPDWALVWGPAMGALTAALGSLVPAWQARSVRVAEVFAKVA